MTMRDARELLIRARDIMTSTEFAFKRDDAFKQFTLLVDIYKFLAETEPKKKGESK